MLGEDGKENAYLALCLATVIVRENKVATLTLHVQPKSTQQKLTDCTLDLVRNLPILYSVLAE